MYSSFGIKQSIHYLEHPHQVLFLSLSRLSYLSRSLFNRLSFSIYKLGPIFAGMVALLNEIRLNQGKPPLGFLNPLLYHIATNYPHSFHSSSDGGGKTTNRCGQGANCCPNGYPSSSSSSPPSFSGSPTARWDPLSGLGSPNFAVLKDIIQQLQ